MPSNLLVEFTESTPVVYGSHATVNQWMMGQVQLNFCNVNWLRQAIEEVEQVLNSSNLDLGILRRHGIKKDVGF